MKKALKIFGIVIGVIVVLIIAAVLILPHVIDPNDYRDDIERAVKDNTGRTLVIAGDMELSLFPWLGVDVSQARLGNAPGFGDTPFATIQNMEVRVRLLSLLFGPTEVGKLKLDGLALNLARKADGKTNWQDLLQRSGGQSSKPESPSKGGFGDITIDSIELSNATINWHDAMAGTDYRLRDVNLTVGAVRPNKPFPMKMNFAVDSTKPVLHANIGLRATATVDPAAKHYRLDDGMVEVSARGAGLPVQPTNVKSTWQTLRFDQAGGTFALDGLKLQALGIEADAVLEGRGLSGKNAQPEISGTLKVADFAPRDVLAKLGRHLQPSDPQVLRHASLSARLAATDHSATLGDVRITLDDTHITGQLAVRDFKTHALAFTLAADKLDADRYLPAGTGEAAKKAPRPGSFDHIRLPGDKLRGLNVDGKLVIGTFKLFNLTARDVTLGINAANGKMTLKPLTAKLYSGTYDGSITAASAGKGLKLATDQRLAGIDMGALLEDLAGRKLISGGADMNVAFAGSGDTVGALKKTLDGKLGFKIQHGAVEGIDLWGAIRRAYAVIKHQPAPKQSGEKKTEFVALNGDGVIKNGVLNNRKLTADLPFMHLAGHGTIDLVKRDLDYRLDAKIIKVPEIDRRSELGKIKGVTVPIHLEGDFANITAFPDLADALKSRIKSKVKSKLEDKLKGKLKGLFKKDDGGHPPVHSPAL